MELKQIIDELVRHATLGDLYLRNDEGELMVVPENFDRVLLAAEAAVHIEELYSDVFHHLDDADKLQDFVGALQGIFNRMGREL